MGVKAALPTIGPAIGSAIASAAAGQLIKMPENWVGIAEEGAAIAKTARQVGLGLEEYQELQFAAKQMGVVQRDFDGAMLVFGAQITRAHEGQGELAAILDEYNISLDNAVGSARSHGEILEDLADVVANESSPTKALDIVIEAFGDNGLYMKNYLQQGGEGIEDGRKEARQHGAVMDEEVARSLEWASEKLTSSNYGGKSDARELIHDVIYEVRELTGDLTFEEQIKALDAELKDLRRKKDRKGLPPNRKRVLEKTIKEKEPELERLKRLKHAMDLAHKAAEGAYPDASRTPPPVGQKKPSDDTGDVSEPEPVDPIAAARTAAALAQVRDRTAELTLSAQELQQYQLDQQMHRYAVALGAAHPELARLTALEQRRLDQAQRAEQILAQHAGQEYLDRSRMRPSEEDQQAAAVKTKAFIEREKEARLAGEEEIQLELQRMRMEETEFARVQARAQAEAWREAGADRAITEEWLAERLRQINDEELAEMRERWLEIGQAGIDAAKNIVNAFEDGQLSANELMSIFNQIANIAMQIWAPESGGAGKGVLGAVSTLFSTFDLFSGSGESSAPFGIGPSPEGAEGGIMVGPRTGFPAILHGTEAVVPLPGGRHIPVEMRGQQAPPVTVNVSNNAPDAEVEEPRVSIDKGRLYVDLAVAAKKHNVGGSRYADHDRMTGGF